jgi:hypothetical protein
MKQTQLLMLFCRLLQKTARNNTKAKAVPLHAMKALGGEEIQLLLLLDLGTLLDRTEWLESHPSYALASGKGPLAHSVQEAGFAPEPLWTEARGKVLCLCQGSHIDRLVIQSIARHYTD